MTTLLAATSLSHFQAEMTRRAAELGVDCWCFDPQCNELAPPRPGEERSDRKLLESAAAAARAGRAKQRPVRTVLANGSELIALPSPQGGVVALLDRSLSTKTRGQLLQILSNYHADLHRADGDQRSIECFNEQLSQTYEEISLLFRMAAALTSTDDTSAVVQKLCDELREVLRYGWLAAVFNEAEAVLAITRHDSAFRQVAV